jgi:hypothetical protein
MMEWIGFTRCTEKHLQDDMFHLQQIKWNVHDKKNRSYFLQMGHFDMKFHTDRRMETGGYGLNLATLEYYRCQIQYECWN